MATRAKLKPCVGCITLWDVFLDAELGKFFLCVAIVDLILLLGIAAMPERR